MNGKLLIVLSLVALVAADDGSSMEQMETKLTRAMDDLNRMDNIKIYGDMVTLDKVDLDMDPELARSSEDALVSSIERFLRTRKIQVRFPDDGSSADLFGRALGQKEVGMELKGLTKGASEARTKLKRIVLPLLLLLKLKAIVVLPIVIAVIGLIGLKGLGAGLMSLLLSGAVALKALLTPPPPARVTYGIVKPEVHHEHWHRSQEEVNQPYRGWAPEYNPEQYPYQDLPL